MKTIYLLPFSILTATSLVAQNVEPTHKHVSYGSHKEMKLNFWRIEAKEPTPLLVHIHGGGFSIRRSFCFEFNWNPHIENDSSLSRHLGFLRCQVAGPTQGRS